jgi:RNA polymerase sigma-70 factor (ECF subfamily)
MDETLTDNELVLKVRQGQAEAFNVLIRRYQARIRALAAQYVANRDDVYDIVQDVFLEAFRVLETFDPDRDFVTWLRSICRHRVMNHFRYTKVRHEAIQSLIDEALSGKREPLDGLGDNSLERLDALKGCVKKLSQRYRQLIHLRYHAQVAVKDIAGQLGQTAAATSMLLYRIRAILARCIERELARENS